MSWRRHLQTLQQYSVVCFINRLVVVVFPVCLHASDPSMHSLLIRQNSLVLSGEQQVNWEQTERQSQSLEICWPMQGRWQPLIHIISDASPLPHWRLNAATLWTTATSHIHSVKPRQMPHDDKKTAGFWSQVLRASLLWVACKFSGSFVFLLFFIPAVSKDPRG